MKSLKHWMQKLNIYPESRRSSSYFKGKNRRYRYLKGLNVLQVSTLDFDRWANSVDLTVDMTGMTEQSFIEIMKNLR